MHDSEFEIPIIPPLTPLAAVRRLKKLLNLDSVSKEERKKTREVARATFGSRTGWKCWICGRKKDDGKSVRYIAAAHIRPIEEGGTTTSTNLIPLCEGEMALSTTLEQVLNWCAAKNEDSRKKKSLAEALKSARICNINNLGCHQFFDFGLISRAKIRHVRRLGSQESGSHHAVRQEALNTPLEFLATDYSPANARQKSVSRLKSKISKLERARRKNIPNWFEINRQLISASRRLSAKKFLQIATKIGNALEKFLNSDDRGVINKRERSAFFYEKAFICMISDPPDLRKALYYLKLSCAEVENSDNPKYQKSEVMSRSEWVHATTFFASEISDDLYKELIDVQNQCLDNINKLNGEDVGRWKMNIDMHRVQLQLKAKKISDARACFTAIINERDKRDVTNGWTPFQGVHMNIIDGVLLAHEAVEFDKDSENFRDRLRSSLRRLARAAATMAAARGKRPEGYKDLAECAAWVLKQIGDEERHAVIDSIAKNIMDGRSGIWVPPDD